MLLIQEVTARFTCWLDTQDILTVSHRHARLLWNRRKRWIFENLLRQTLHYEQCAIFSWELTRETEACSLWPQSSHEHIQVEGLMTYAWVARGLVGSDPEWSSIWLYCFPKRTTQGFQLTFYLIHAAVHLNHLEHTSYFVK